MKRIASGLLFLICTVYPAFACVNISGTKFNGESVTSGHFIPAIRLVRSEQTDLRIEGEKMEEYYRGSTNFTDRSDYSVALMYLGRYQDAVGLLQALEKESPGNYSVAANLGTAYELAGNNVEALKWIKEAINRNATSHAGSEWLHVKILESKIAGGSNPDYLKSHPIFGLHAETVHDGISVDGNELSSREVADAMQYQLEERMKFVKPTDPIVAGLLFDYAAIEAATRTLESARGLLNLALDYGYPSEQIQPLLKEYDRKIAWRKTRQNGIYAFAGLVFIAGLAVLYKRGIFVISRRDLKPRQN